MVKMGRTGWTAPVLGYCGQWDAGKHIISFFPVELTIMQIKATTSTAWICFGKDLNMICKRGLYNVVEQKSWFQTRLKNHSRIPFQDIFIYRKKHASGYQQLMTFCRRPRDSWVSRCLVTQPVEFPPWQPDARTPKYAMKRKVLGAHGPQEKNKLRIITRPRSRWSPNQWKIHRFKLA